MTLKDIFKDKAKLERILTHHTLKGPLKLDSLSEQVWMHKGVDSLPDQVWMLRGDWG